jgi:hypothetical protein
MFRAVLGDVLENLVEDLIGPLRLDQAGLGDSDQQIAEGAGVQHVRVEQHHETHSARPIS